MYASQTYFGFINMGSNMHRFNATAIYFQKLSTGTPCNVIFYSVFQNFCPWLYVQSFSRKNYGRKWPVLTLSVWPSGKILSCVVLGSVVSIIILQGVIMSSSLFPWKKVGYDVPELRILFSLAHKLAQAPSILTLCTF